MRVRVFQPVDSPARIVRPLADLRGEGESESDFLERIAAQTVAHDPTLSGLPFIDMDDADLPAERTRVVDAAVIPVRNAWRVDGDAVSVDEDVVADLVAAQSEP